MSASTSEQLHVIVVLPDDRVVLQRYLQYKWACTFNKPLMPLWDAHALKAYVANVMYCMFAVRLAETVHTFEKLLNFSMLKTDSITVYKLKLMKDVSFTLAKSMEVLPVSFLDLADTYTKNTQIFEATTLDVVSTLDLMRGNLS